MKKGAYVLIFLFWAFLTIITPTLVQWSAAAAAATAGDSQSKGDTSGESSNGEGLVRSRKMMKLTQETELEETKLAPPRPSPVLGVPVSLPPAPAPKDDERTEEEPEVVALLGEGSSN